MVDWYPGSTRRPEQSRKTFGEKFQDALINIAQSAATDVINREVVLKPMLYARSEAAEGLQEQRDEAEAARMREEIAARVAAEKVTHSRNLATRRREALSEVIAAESTKAGVLAQSALKDALGAATVEWGSTKQFGVIGGSKEKLEKKILDLQNSRDKEKKGTTRYKQIDSEISEALSQLQDLTTAVDPTTGKTYLASKSNRSKRVNQKQYMAILRSTESLLNKIESTKKDVARVKYMAHNPIDPDTGQPYGPRFEEYWDELKVRLGRKGTADHAMKRSGEILASVQDEDSPYSFKMDDELRKPLLSGNQKRTRNIISDESTRGTKKRVALPPAPKKPAPKTKKKPVTIFNAGKSDTSKPDPEKLTTTTEARNEVHFGPPTNLASAMDLDLRYEDAANAAIKARASEVNEHILAKRKSEIEAFKNTQAFIGLTNKIASEASDNAALKDQLKTVMAAADIETRQKLMATLLDKKFNEQVDKVIDGAFQSDSPHTKKIRTKVRKYLVEQYAHKMVDALSGDDWDVFDAERFKAVFSPITTKGLRDHFYHYGSEQVVHQAKEYAARIIRENPSTYKDWYYKSLTQGDQRTAEELRWLHGQMVLITVEHAQKNPGFLNDNGTLDWGTPSAGRLVQRLNTVFNSFITPDGRSGNKAYSRFVGAMQSKQQGQVKRGSIHPTR